MAIGFMAAMKEASTQGQKCGSVVSKVVQTRNYCRLIYFRPVHKINEKHWLVWWKCISSISVWMAVGDSMAL